MDRPDSPGSFPNISSYPVSGRLDWNMIGAKYEFQATLHRNSREMHDAIAEEWLSAGGSNSKEEILRLLTESDESLAAEAAMVFGLDAHPAFSRVSLREAFGRIRDDVETRFPKDL